MRNLVTTAWIESRDIAGLIHDSTSLEDAIVQVSYEIAEIVGHDFGDSTSADETLDGVLSDTLYLAGLTRYPLRTLTSITFDDSEITITSDYLRQYANSRLGGLIDKLRLKYSTWDTDEIVITGNWGWTDTPDDVKEAVYRILVKRLTGTAYGSTTQAGDTPIKRVKHKDGLEIEFAVSEQSSNDSTGWTTGDSFADSVIANYIWRAMGGVV